MSHITQLRLQLKNLDCVKRAAARMEGATIVGTGKQKLMGKDRNILEFRLPTFTMPIYIDIKTGEVFNDNFEGHWGKLTVYNKFLQLYASEVGKEFAEKNNYSYEEEELEDGKIRCTLGEKDTVSNYSASGGYDVG